MMVKWTGPKPCPVVVVCGGLLFDVGVLLGLGRLFGLRSRFGELNLFRLGVEDGEVLGVVALAVDASGALGVDDGVLCGLLDDFDAILDEAGAFVEASGADDAEVLFFVLCAEELDELLVVGACFGETCLEAFLCHALLVLPDRLGVLLYGFGRFVLFGEVFLFRLDDRDGASLDEDGFEHLVCSEHLLCLVIELEELLRGEVGEFLPVEVNYVEFEFAFDLEGEIGLELSFCLFGGESGGLDGAEERSVVLLVSDDGDVVATGVAEGVDGFHGVGDLIGVKLCFVVVCSYR